MWNEEIFKENRNKKDSQNRKRAVEMSMELNKEWEPGEFGTPRAYRKQGGEWQ